MTKELDELVDETKEKESFFSKVGRRIKKAVVALAINSALLYVAVHAANWYGITRPNYEGYINGVHVTYKENVPNLFGFCGDLEHAIDAILANKLVMKTADGTRTYIDSCNETQVGYVAVVDGLIVDRYGESEQYWGNHVELDYATRNYNDIRAAIGGDLRRQGPLAKTSDALFRGVIGGKSVLYREGTLDYSDRVKQEKINAGKRATLSYDCGIWLHFNWLSNHSRGSCLTVSTDRETKYFYIFCGDKSLSLDAAQATEFNYQDLDVLVICNSEGIREIDMNSSGECFAYERAECAKLMGDIRRTLLRYAE
ncbi:hypothetical protein COV18_03085 [Candidatus Woesearchaeota archaeon CG10_big_fil_rev_8_21_14_0_10_37_12]|nr:MAG: hypothetical protein COV18_03085 [Candidatus Woesearchaeota archaeon CG10_big_fil_rev_8_21_14_0_10_37_12]